MVETAGRKGRSSETWSRPSLRRYTVGIWPLCGPGSHETAIDIKFLIDKNFFFVNEV